MSEPEFELSVPQLRCFVAVAAAGSVAEAARRLGMSAASVSKAIARLEDGAGIRLLHRSTHAMSLTDDGRALLEPARETLRAAQAFEDVVAQTADGGSTGTVRITAAVAFVRSVLVPLLGELARLHPEIRLDIRATNELVDLADEGIDLAIRSGSLARVPGHVHQLWFTCPWIMCAAPTYLAQHPAPRSIAELAGHAVVGFRNQRTGRVQPWPHRDGSYEPQPLVTFDDGEAAFGAIVVGAGIGCVPLYLAAPALRAGAVVEVLGDARGDEISISMIRRERRLTPSRLAAVMSFLAARAPELADLR